MCGFSGFLYSSGVDYNVLQVSTTMSEQIISRGPDDFGVWSDDENGIALNHRRLSVLGLGPSGRQPMSSSTGRYRIVFNGEIYNHLEIRKSLSFSSWKGGSDTETLLEAFENWGIEATLQKITGMFSFALWDSNNKKIYLSRDRMGEKPLYYGWSNGVFFFGSDLKSFTVHPSFVKTIDRDALAQFIRFSYVPTPKSIYQNISKLETGSLLTLDCDLHSIRINRPVRIKKYWSASHVINSLSDRRKEPIDDGELIKELEDKLYKSVRQQMISDVPIGAFLSGGIDSSIIASLMQKAVDKPIKTFTIGFNESDYNEAKHAKKVANILGTDHTELYIDPNAAIDVIPMLPDMYSEPFADVSQIPTFLVSKMAKSSVTVALSGDGGDELFGGYNRYIWSAKVWKNIEKYPYYFRNMSSNIMSHMPPAAINKFSNIVNGLMPWTNLPTMLGDKAHKAFNIFSSRSSDEIYLKLISQWNSPCDIVIGSNMEDTMPNYNPELITSDSIEKMMFLDTVMYLPDDILTKVDRASMGASLEVRSPMLNHEIFEFAWSMPLNTKIRGGVGKWALKEVLYKYIPKNIVDRPKMGFGVPIDSWLRGPLVEWAEELLDENRLNREGYFVADQIRVKWEEHKSGKRNWQYQLWNILMFQLWLENNI